jgi:hypothetical protein
MTSEATESTHSHHRCSEPSSRVLISPKELVDDECLLVMARGMACAIAAAAHECDSSSQMRIYM